jgi:glycosyltransferase involved in cell wall biosynthesis
VKKRVLFDGLATQGTSQVKFHGGGEYAKYILRKAIELGYRNFDVVFSKKLVIDENIEKLLKETEDIQIYWVENINEVYAILDTNSYDCFYSALAWTYRGYKSDVLFVMVIHGLRAVELKIPWDEYRHKYSSNIFNKFMLLVVSKIKFLHLYLQKKCIKELESLFVIKNKKIITDSEHSKYSFLFYFPYLKEHEINIYYPNIELGDITPNSGGGKNKYFLMISANRWEKNICRVVDAFDSLFDHDQLDDKYVVITGCVSCGYLKKIRNKNRFELLPYVSEPELEDLYRHAFAFIYPSLNEGFGIPPLRAMKYGIPVAASAATSIPEICGNAALYFDPHFVGDIANRILQLIHNQNLYETLVKSGYRQYQQYQQYKMPEMIKEIFEFTPKA